MASPDRPGVILVGVALHATSTPTQRRRQIVIARRDLPIDLGARLPLNQATPSSTHRTR